MVQSEGQYFSSNLALSDATCSTGFNRNIATDASHDSGESKCHPNTPVPVAILAEFVQWVIKQSEAVSFMDLQSWKISYCLKKCAELNLFSRAFRS